MYHCLVQLLCFHEKIEVDHFIPWARPIITFFFLAFYEVIQHLKNAATRLILFFFSFLFFSSNPNSISIHATGQGYLCWGCRSWLLEKAVSSQIYIQVEYMLREVICAGKEGRLA
jgi:hypothetical protein